MILTPQINLTPQTVVHAKIAYVGNELRDLLSEDLSTQFEIDHQELSLNNLEQYLNDQSLLTLPDILLIEADKKESWIAVIGNIKQNPLLQGMIIVVLSAFSNKQWKAKAMSLKIHDFYTYPFPIEDLTERLGFLVKFKLIKPKLAELSQTVDVRYKMPLYKRVFDIFVSGAALLVLSPFLLIIAALIKLESKGPVI